MTRLSHFTDVWFYFTAQRERESSETERWKKTKTENGETHSERAREISLHRVCMRVQYIRCVYVLHLSNGFRQVGGNFTQPLPSAVHNVVTAGAGLWAL